MENVKNLPEAEKIMELPISYEERGKEIGRQEGIREGRFGEKREVAIRMLRRGTPLDLIAEFTLLEKEEIQKLRNQIES